jgi:hypothetical protein
MSLPSRLSGKKPSPLVAALAEAKARVATSLARELDAVKVFEAACNAHANVYDKTVEAKHEVENIEAEIALDKLPKALRAACLVSLTVSDQQALARRGLMKLSEGDRFRRASYHWTPLGGAVLSILRGETPRLADREKGVAP